MTKIEIACAICGAPFHVTQSRLDVGGGKYCSNECRHEGKRRQLFGSNSNFWLGGKSITKPCASCGVDFTAFASRKTAAFCSKACADQGRVGRFVGSDNPSWGGGKVEITCRQCGAVRSVFKSQSARMFCSMACKVEAQRKPKVSLECAACGKRFDRFPCEVEKATEHYCSHKCRGDGFGSRQIGADNPQWKGGVTPENKKARECKEMFEWKRSVFERDNYTCQVCGDRSGKGRGAAVTLHAHYIKPFATNPELRFDTTNGVTLCVPCHKLVHSRRKP